MKYNELLELEYSMKNLSEDMHRSVKRFHRDLIKLRQINPENRYFLDFLLCKRTLNISVSRLSRIISIYFLYLDEINIRDLTKSKLLLLFTQIRNSSKCASTKKTEWIIIKQIMNHFELDKNINYKDWRLRLKKDNNKFRNDLVNRKDLDFLLSRQIDYEKKAYIIILLCGALRPQEIFSLKKDNFFKKDNIWHINVKVSKTDPREVIVYEHQEIIDTLLSGYWDGWTFSYPAISKTLRKYSSKLNKRIYNYIFRHSCITNLCEREVSPAFIKDYVGWTTLEQLKTYAHISKEKCLKNVAGCGVLEESHL